MSTDIAAPDLDDETLLTNMSNAIRALSMDAVQQANSGHPGMPMGAADLATALFVRHLNFDPSRPDWAGRDRFVLSAGHGSMLLYSLLYLTGYEKPTLQDIKNFRQLHSPTAGHPEFGEAPGIEVTTGPLGQGLATAVGMALGERLANARFGDQIIDNHTYVLAGDGCLQEGVSQEAISLAGHLKLSKMIVLWDDNSISIDGDTDISTSEDIAARFEAAGWHVQRVDGHDVDSVDAAIGEAKLSDKPSLIACKTTIGFGSPNKAGTAGVHGAPLGADEIALVREKLGWAHGPFEVPEDVLAAWRFVGRAGAEKSANWDKSFAQLSANDQADFQAMVNPEPAEALTTALRDYQNDLIREPVKVATRKASQMALEVVNKAIGNTIGGSADLTGSNLTKTSDMQPVNASDFSGRYIHYGIREFGMAAAMNGLSLYGMHIPYGGTFLVFTDYARPAMRLAALMGIRAIYVMTHDSIGLGEDGPTHQPVEHLASLRAMPNMRVLRPADAVETAEAWEIALARTDGPTVLSLSRQGVPQVRTTGAAENLSTRGGYILKEAEGAAPKAVIVATGTEVELAIKAQETLAGEGVQTRVVSMPSVELFLAQDAGYRGHVLPADLPKVSIEAASTYGWKEVLGDYSEVIGMSSFGASAPAGDLYKHFGITADAVVAAVKKHL